MAREPVPRVMAVPFWLGEGSPGSGEPAWQAKGKSREGGQGPGKRQGAKVSHQGEMGQQRVSHAYSKTQ